MQRWIVSYLLIGLLVSCTGNARLSVVEEIIPTVTEGITLTSTPIEQQFDLVATMTNTIPPQPTSAETPSPQLCALFAGEGLENLMERLTNPFFRPQPGSDNPHQGVDFSDLDPLNRIALSGKAVSAILPGRVAMVLADRFPYGNAVLIETDYQDLPAAWQQKVPARVIEREIFHTNLTCPGAWEDAQANTQAGAFYILYAHFENEVPFQVEDRIQCGQEIGQIGMSGNALAPHVHVEMRWGPSGAVFADMAHYDSSASPLAMENYCRWRVSGWYQLLDPMGFLLIQ